MAHHEGHTVAPFPVVRTGLTDAECRALVEQQPLVTYVDGLGEDVRTLFISDNVLELSGYPAAWWRSEDNDFFSILHPDDVDAVRSAHIASARAGTPYKSDFRLVKPSGEIVWVQAEDRPIRGDDGRPLYRLGNLVDVTERRATEDELRRTGTRLTTLIDSLHVGVLLEDEHRHVAMTNQAFCDIFGVPAPPAQLVGADCAAAVQQSKLLAADPEVYLERIDEILAARLPVQGEEVEFADGRVFERDYVPIVVGGEHGGHLWGYRDVTPRIEAQRAVEEALTLDDVGQAIGPWLTGAGDVEATLDRMAEELGSAAPVRKVAETWLGELPGRLDDLDAASRHRDASRLRDGAHTLKSTCALVGASEAAELAAGIERRAADGDASDTSRVEVLRSSAEAAAARIRDWMHAQAAGR